jgi:hypothetical protein
MPRMLTPSCAHHTTTELPSFPTRAALAANSTWRRYYTSVYGTDFLTRLQDSDFPWHTSNADMLYADSLRSAGLVVSFLRRAATKTCIEYAQSCDGTPSLVGRSQHWDPAEAGVWLKSSERRSLPAHSWVEVSHCASAYERSGTWFYHTRGSGVFVYTGATRAFSQHDEAFLLLLGVRNGSSTGALGHKLRIKRDSVMWRALRTRALELGLQSLQFLHHADQRCGNMATELLLLFDVGGGFPCEPRWQLRTGLHASRGCTCGGRDALASEYNRPSRTSGGAGPRRAPVAGIGGAAPVGSCVTPWMCSGDEQTSTEYATVTSQAVPTPARTLGPIHAARHARGGSGVISMSRRPTPRASS